jgi:hypothetical protein
MTKSRNRLRTEGVPLLPSSKITSEFTKLHRFTVLDRWDFPKLSDIRKWSVIWSTSTSIQIAGSWQVLAFASAGPHSRRHKRVNGIIHNVLNKSWRLSEICLLKGRAWLSKLCYIQTKRTPAKGFHVVLIKIAATVDLKGWLQSQECALDSYEVSCAVPRHGDGC